MQVHMQADEYINNVREKYRFWKLTPSKLYDSIYLLESLHVPLKLCKPQFELNISTIANNYHYNVLRV